MYMPLLKVDYEIGRQIRKIDEEFGEFMGQKIPVTKEEKEADISEALDIITAVCTYITHEYNKEELKKALIRHRQKLDSRGWKYKGNITINLEDANNE